MASEDKFGLIAASQATLRPASEELKQYRHLIPAGKTWVVLTGEPWRVWDGDEWLPNPRPLPEWQQAMAARRAAEAEASEGEESDYEDYALKKMGTGLFSDVDAARLRFAAADWF